MWEGIFGQMLGSAVQTRDYSSAYGAMSPYLQGNYIPISPTPTYYMTSTGANDTISIDNADMEVVEEKTEKPPDEFTQLSNHKFHELLDRFSKTI